MKKKLKKRTSLVYKFDFTCRTPGGPVCAALGRDESYGRETHSPYIHGPWTPESLARAVCSTSPFPQVELKRFCVYTPSLLTFSPQILSYCSLPFKLGVHLVRNKLRPLSLITFPHLIPDPFSLTQARPGSCTPGSHGDAVVRDTD